MRPIAVNGSRNKWIDEAVAPGPYTELLPCIDLCYQVVQSCPPFMAFNCPKGDLAALQYGYWKARANDSLVSCNPVGLEARRLVISEAPAVNVRRLVLLGVCVAAILLLL